ncbi:CBS domain-containing protein CBSX3, mitochondrial-like [Durio zibethinus]|uniref:CBS domain-containing protein CBSX3, mitochondrial-like n=1 Tax=Durio zibethinus TaxID=66656 RepID=A0A6P6B6A5_DURZI|nr:CBS domain-containing protein CBSX3, mitochondrial-like [Durio zibethinus]
MHDYLRKIRGQGRSPKYKSWGNHDGQANFSFSFVTKLMTVKSDTSILQCNSQQVSGMYGDLCNLNTRKMESTHFTFDLREAMTTDNNIRHVPVIDERIVGMVSIVDVVRAMVDQQNRELKRLNAFIKGDYY